MKQKRKYIVCVFLVVVILFPLLALAGDNSEGINEAWLETVLSIEVVDESGIGTPIGSGFLIKTPNNHMILVTAKHVIRGTNNRIRPNLAYRFNKKNGESFLVADKLLQENTGDWFVSKPYDVACRFIRKEESTKFLVAEYKDFLSKNALKPAAPILVLGFPLGLRSEDHSNPIVRKGIVARIDPTNILIDAFIFPGNSGGPVLYSPTVRLGKGLTSSLINEEKLIGLVSSYIPYIDTAMSIHTKRPRITFEENSGISNVVPSDHILELLTQDDVKSFDASLK